ncbi:5818_t:CDS:2, partial [Cetraspora pellucida]
VLEALKSGSSISTMKSIDKVLSINKNNIINNVINVDDDIQNEVAESSSRFPLNEVPLRSPLNEALSRFLLSKIFTNTLENPSINAECKQNTSIMEKQEALETMLTQLTNDIKTLQLSYKRFKLKTTEKEYK